MQKIPILFAILILLLAAVCHAQQQSETSEIYVESWATGNQIRETVRSFDLESSKPKQTEIIRDIGSGVYKLILTLHPAVKERSQREFWVVELRRVLSDRNKREKLGDNLLRVVGPPGPGQDYFPREDLIADLYPRESTKIDMETLGQPNGGGRPNGGYYPIGAKRVIKVQNFYVIIQVTAFELNKTDPSKLDSMRVTVEFSNSCRNRK